MIKRKSFFAAAIIAVAAFVLNAAVAPATSALEACKCDNPVESNILGNCEYKGKKMYCDQSGEGKGIKNLLVIGVNILLAGVVVAGTVGIIISGVTIMTAREDEAQVAKAKRRILDIVIGIAAFALFWLMINLLLPSVDKSVVNTDESGMNQQGPGGGPNSTQKNPNTTPTNPTNSPNSTPTTPTTPTTPSNPTTPTTPSTNPNGTPSVTATKTGKPILPLRGNSNTIPCDPRTTTYKTVTNAHYNKTKVAALNLCKVPNITGSNIVNSRVSGAFYEMAQAYYNKYGKKLNGSSSFRAYEDQVYFWNCYQQKKRGVTNPCNGGNTAAEPGSSNHEMGLAIDFDVPKATNTNNPVTSCPSSPGWPNVTDKQSINRWKYTEMSRWFCNNLGTFGLSRRVTNEPWHVDPSSY